MILVVAVVLIAAGISLGVGATRQRRRRWRDAQPFAGGERAAPEPAVVPSTIIYLVYVGWLLVIAGTAAAVATSI
jgi:uncharacterized membrane protein HdeD (DUF308 family)